MSVKKHKTVATLKIETALQLLQTPVEAKDRQKYLAAARIVLHMAVLDLEYAAMECLTQDDFQHQVDTGLADLEKMLFAWGTTTEGEK